MSFINLSTVTKALEEQIRSDIELTKLGHRVERGRYINMIPDLAMNAPWIGVYKSNTDYEPRSLGKHSNTWDGSVLVRIIVQAAHGGGDGSKCEDRLADWEGKVLDAIWSDATWGGTIDMVESLKSEYFYNETESESLYFQQVVITISARLSTG